MILIYKGIADKTDDPRFVLKTGDKVNFEVLEGRTRLVNNPDLWEEEKINGKRGKTRGSLHSKGSSNHDDDGGDHGERGANGIPDHQRGKTEY